MNILIIARGIPTEKYPQIGIFEYDQARALAALGHKIYFFAVDFRSIRRKRSYGLHNGKSDGICWYRLDIPIGAVPICISCGIGKWAIRFLYKKVYCRKKKPDIIHAHFTEQGYMASYLAKKEHIPLVITEHSSILNQDNISPALLRYTRKGYHAADQVIAVGTHLAANIKKRTRIQCEIVPNIVSKDIFAEKKETTHKGFGFVMTGNLIYRKCPQLLLEAYMELHKKYSDIYLGYIGDGELKSDLERKVRQAGMDAYVKFYGVLTRTEMAEVYTQYDCFVLPSMSETFGVAYIEAMAAGLPVIATRCGGPEDFVTGETGYLISVNNKKELVNAMENMYHRKGAFQKEKIRQYVKKHFSEKVIADRLTNVYLRIIEQQDEIQKGFI